MAARLNFCGEGTQIVGSFPSRALTPGRQGPVRRLYGKVDIDGRGARDAGDLFAVTGVEYRQLAGAAGGLPDAVDKQLGSHASP
ncbi:hypothetical protein PSEUDO8BK_30451 [Pseudomonas sp. 8BK]|nr:hypothetical protein PSEUDO8BK_30451 [Pseudomonas sp. 8BK]